MIQIIQYFGVLIIFTGFIAGLDKNSIYKKYGSLLIIAGVAFIFLGQVL